MWKNVWFKVKQWPSLSLELPTNSWFLQQEDDSDCGGGTCLSPNLWLVLGLQLLLLLSLTKSSQHSWPKHTHWDSHAHHISSEAWRHSACAIQDVCRVFAALTACISVSIFLCQRVLIHFFLIVFNFRDTFPVLSCAHFHTVYLYPFRWCNSKS